jgi:hypothetical protein
MISFGFKQGSPENLATGKSPACGIQGEYMTQDAVMIIGGGAPAISTGVTRRKPNLDKSFMILKQEQENK